MIHKNTLKYKMLNIKYKICLKITFVLHRICRFVWQDPSSIASPVSAPALVAQMAQSRPQPQPAIFIQTLRAFRRPNTGGFEVWRERGIGRLGEEQGLVKLDEEERNKSQANTGAKLTRTC